MSVAADSKIITIMGPRKPQLLVKVVSVDGVPIGGVKVDVGSIIWELTPLRLGLFTKTTDDNGLVSIDGLLPGGYLIHAYDESRHVQGTPGQTTVDLLGKASPDTLNLTLHAAPWYYTLKITYPAVIGIGLAQIMSAMLDVEKAYMGAHFDEVRVIGETVEIDFHITEESPFVITPALVVAIFVGLGVLIVLGVVSWVLVERFIPPAQKDRFCVDGVCFSDQAGLAQYLIGKGDPKPWMCAYVGCNLRFSTEGEKIAHMEQFHKVEEIPIIEIAAIVAAAIVVIGLGSAAMGRPVVLPITGEEAERLRAEEARRREEEERARAEAYR